MEMWLKITTILILIVTNVWSMEHEEEVFITSQGCSMDEGIEGDLSGLFLGHCSLRDMNGLEGLRELSVIGTIRCLG